MNNELTDLPKIKTWAEFDKIHWTVKLVGGRWYITWTALIDISHYQSLLHLNIMNLYLQFSLCSQEIINCHNSTKWGSQICCKILTRFQLHSWLIPRWYKFGSVEVSPLDWLTIWATLYPLVISTVVRGLPLDWLTTWFPLLFFHAPLLPLFENFTFGLSHNLR